MSKLTPFVDLNQQTIAVCARLGILRPLRFTAGVVELVDTTDSKSVAREGLRVRVPPLVPHRDNRRNESVKSTES